MTENIVYIGRKPVMAYVMAIITAMNNQDNDEVVIKARGRSISAAVDAAEVTRNRYLNDLKSTVAIGTEEMETEDGGTRNVSTIAITLSKSPEAMEPRGRELTTEAERLPERELKGKKGKEN